MAKQSMILDMLKTPAQVREEQLTKLRERSLAQASLLKAPQATTGIPGLLTGFAQQELANIPVDFNQMARRAFGGAGALARGMGASPETAGAISRGGMSGEEQQALITQNILKSANMKDPASMMAAADKLRQSGNTQAAQLLTEKAQALDLQLKELDFKRREIEAKEGKLELDEDKAFLSRTLGIDSNVLASVDPTSAAQAVNILKSKLPYESQEAVNTRARNVLKMKPTGKGVQVSYDLNGLADIFREAAAESEGKEAAKTAEDAFKTLQESALQSTSLQRDINATRSTLTAFEAAGGEPGRLEELKRSSLGLLRGFGVDLPYDQAQQLDLGEFIDFLANRGLTQLAGTFKGSQSEKELLAIQRMTPQARYQPNTLRRIINILQTEVYANQFIYKEGIAYRNANRGRILGWDPVNSAIKFNNLFNELVQLQTLRQQQGGTLTNQADEDRRLELLDQLTVYR